jgi:Pyruvate/2-oxoacid:ferredoxin oxidoreductase delta subunit
MSEESYRKLAKVLDTLPNGFPPTESGLEIRLLKRIFAPEEAELFCDLRLTFETAEQIAERTGRPLEGLEEMLTSMWKEKGQILGANLGDTSIFRMVPWVVGIYEFQVDRMDRELAEMCNEYYECFAAQRLGKQPHGMRSIPIGQALDPTHRALSYDHVSGIIEQGQSFLVSDCICKKEARLLDNGCDHPLEVCLIVGPLPGLFDDAAFGRPISKQEAYAVLDKAQQAGLVHMTANLESGHSFICNCCGCCCMVLKGMTKFGIEQVVNSDFYSQIDAQLCTDCGICADELCQVDAIAEQEGAYRVDRARCLGCGQCVDACPVEAIQLVRKGPEDRVPPVKDGDTFLDEIARQRGVDYSAYK